MKYALVLILSLLLALPAFAESQTACAMRWDKVVKQAERANQCNEDADCDYVTLYDCTKGCATLPVYKNLKTPLEVAAASYHKGCAQNCAPDCGRPVQASCIRNDCTIDLRDWKYLSKQK